MKRDGTGLRQLTNDAALDRMPHWSADGKRLMFYSSRGGRFQVWTIAADGGGLRQVTDYPDAVLEPLWSPDGTRVVAHVSRIRMATSSLPSTIRGTATPGAGTHKTLMFDPRVPAGQQKVEELPPFSDGDFDSESWSPDGTRIAGVVSRPGGKDGIVVYTVASRTYEEVTRSGSMPRWLPDGRRLLYNVGGGLALLDTLMKTSTPVFSAPPRENLGSTDLSPDAREIFKSFGNDSLTSCSPS